MKTAIITVITPSKREGITTLTLDWSGRNTEAVLRDFDLSACGEVLGMSQAGNFHGFVDIEGDVTAKVGDVVYGNA